MPSTSRAVEVCFLIGERDAVLWSDASASPVALPDSRGRAAGLPLVHAALAGDGSCGLVRWDERFAPDREDTAGQATCEGGEHLPMIGLLSATLARAIQDFVRADQRGDYLVTPSGVLRT